MKPYNLLVTEIQSALYAFIFSLLGDSEGANDVLQETNLVLWQKEDEFDPERRFSSWAYKIAYFQVLAYRKRGHGDRHVFDDELVSKIATEFPADSADHGERLDALNKCIKRLTDRQRHLLSQRYEKAMSVAAIARQLGSKAGAIKVALFRIRAALAECIERNLRQEGTA